MSPGSRGSRNRQWFDGMTLSIQTLLNQGRGCGVQKHSFNQVQAPCLWFWSALKEVAENALRGGGRAGKGKVGIRPQMLRGRGWGAGSQASRAAQHRISRDHQETEASACLLGPDPQAVGQMSGPAGSTQGRRESSGRANKILPPVSFCFLILSLVLDRSVHHLRTGLLFYCRINIDIV